jgi:hypothetical protein
VGAVIAALATREVIAVAIVDTSVSRWLTLANGTLIGCLATAGLILHEHTSERIIHVLEVAEPPHHEHA